MSRSLKKGPYVDPKLAKKVAALRPEDRTLIKTSAPPLPPPVRVLPSRHTSPANSWSDAHTALPAGTAYLDILVLFVTDTANTSHSLNAN